MTAKALTISALLAFSLCAAQGQEAASQEPELLARVDVDSALRLSQNAGRFAEKLKPGSSGLIALGLIGLTVNPQLAAYDMSQPFSVLLYEDPSKAAIGPLGFCGVAARRSEKPSAPFLKYASFDMVARDFGERGAIASSEGILKRAPEDFLSGLSQDSQGQKPDIALWIDPARAFKAFPIGGLKGPQDSGRQLVPADKLEALEGRRARWKALDSLLLQASSLKSQISFTERGKLLLALELKASEGSALAAFLQGQRSDGAPRRLPGAASAPGASVFGSANIATTKSLIAALGAMQKAVSEARGESKRAGLHESLALAAAGASTGRVSFCAGLRFNKPYSLSCFELDKEGSRKVYDALQALGGRTATPGLQELRALKAGVSTFSLFENGRLWLLWGSFDEDGAADLLAGRQLLDEPAAEDGLLASLSLGPDASGRNLGVWALPGNSLKIKLELSPADLESLPLPEPPSPQGAKGVRLQLR